MRTRIWAWACPAPRTRYVEIYDFDCATFSVKIRYIPRLPPLFHTSSESRRVGIAQEGGSIIDMYGNSIFYLCRHTIAFYFNFDRYILFLSSRFERGGRTTESVRLESVARLIPTEPLRQIKRLLVTYSGLDSYEQIGPTLRPYASLEVLYVGMKDQWSSRAVVRMLEKGKPSPNVVAEKINRNLIDTEAEETDDDEEPEEVSQLRLAVRTRRRIVEVDLRLDE